MRALFVDDEGSWRELFRAACDELQIECECRGDADSAVEKLAEVPGRFGLLGTNLDLKSPKDGLYLIQEAAKCKCTRILVVTGSPSLYQYGVPEVERMSWLRREYPEILGFHLKIPTPPGLEPHQGLVYAINRVLKKPHPTSGSLILATRKMVADQKLTDALDGMSILVRRSRDRQSELLDLLSRLISDHNMLFHAEIRKTLSPEYLHTQRRDLVERLFEFLGMVEAYLGVQR